LQRINPSTSSNELNTTLTPHSITHGDACFAYFNKIWGIPCSKKGSLFITSSASASSDGGTVSPEYIGRHVVDARIGLINQDKRGCGDDTANI
jgi:hypothetical protein